MSKNDAQTQMPRESQFFKPIILITGCASGIGLALAHLLYRHTQYRVIATARASSVLQLEQIFTQGDRFWIRALDVTSAAERTILVHDICERWGAINILINNAGISYRAVVEHMTDFDEQRQMATNYLGPMALIRLVLPTMRELGRGKIINVSSVSGMLAMPTMSSYSASKFALEGASESLWYEMRPFGIDICLIQPGFIHSNSFKNVYYSHASAPEQNRNGPYSDYYSNMSPFVERLMRRSRATPEKVAQIIFKAIQTERPQLWIPATFDAVMFYYLRRLLPRRILLPFLFWALPRAKYWGNKHTRRREW